MSSPYQTGATDPRLLASNAIAKAKDVEARLNTVIGGLNAVPPSIVYTTNSVVVSQNANGVYTWACPAGITSAYVECWGLAPALAVAVLPGRRRRGFRGVRGRAGCPADWWHDLHLFGRERR